MNNEHFVLPGGLKASERRARQLVSNTLAPVKSRISAVAVRVLHDGLGPEDAFRYRCTILVRLLDGTILRSEGRDCDEMLAIYAALSQTIDSLARSDQALSDEFR
jgi:hypothetical protein